MALALGLREPFGAEVPCGWRPHVPRSWPAMRLHGPRLERSPWLLPFLAFLRMRGIRGKRTRCRCAHSASLAALEEKYPDAPEGELLRFARARWRDPKAAVAMYEANREWRKGEGDPEQLALAFAKVPSGFCGGGFDGALDGTQVLLVQGARYNLEAAAKPEEYTLAICHVLDGLFTESEEMRVTVLIDVRRGYGWPNPPALKLLPFIRSCARIISAHYPERLRRLIIFPMPWFTTAILAIVKRLLDPVTFSKFVFVTGEDAEGAPCNAAELRKYISKASLPKHALPMFEDL